MIEPVFYAMDSPLGEIRIAAENDIPVRISLTGNSMAKKAGAVKLPVNISQLMLAVRAYFDGGNISLNLAEKVLRDYVSVPPFTETVLRRVIRIPRGRTLSYGEVAAAAGKPGAARAVGNIMRENPFPIIIPCHRVIKADGSPGGYGSHPRMKVWLLGFESAPVSL